jgi:hypothetical protein
MSAIIFPLCAFGAVKGVLRLLVATSVVKIKAAHAVPCIVKNGKTPLHVCLER